LLISDSFWRRRFGADPSVLGRSLLISDEPYIVVGVLPRSYEPLISEHFYERADVWAPLGYDVSLSCACRDCRHLKALGRVRAGTPLDAALADLDTVQQQLVQEFPSAYVRKPMVLAPLWQELTGNLRPALTALMGAVILVVLIACANVANLLLSRLAARRRNIALCAALGASRARLVRQLLVESAILALAGAGLRSIVGLALVPALVRFALDATVRVLSIHADARVLGFAAIATLATTLARRLLIAGDVALAVVLLVAAGLMIRSVGQLPGVDPGFDPDYVLTMQVSMLGRAYASKEAVVAKGDAMIAQLHQLPSVEAVALAGQIPLGGN
jgi:putative ABC transport system permease protein